MPRDVEDGVRLGVGSGRDAISRAGQQPEQVEPSQSGKLGWGVYYKMGSGEFSLDPVGSGPLAGS